MRVRCENLLKAADGPLLLQAQQRLSRTEQLLGELNVIPIDQTSVQQFDRLRTAKKLRKCGRADLLIASIALANSATLVTRNVQHFRQIPNLAIENWVA